MHIDIHCHLFNTWYLPLRGIVRHVIPTGPRTATWLALAIRTISASIDRGLDTDKDATSPAGTHALSGADVAPPDLPSLDVQADEAVDVFLDQVDSRMFYGEAYEEMASEMRDEASPAIALLPEIAASKTPVLRTAVGPDDLRNRRKAVRVHLTQSVEERQQLQGFGILDRVAELFKFVMRIRARERRLLEELGRLHASPTPGVGLFVYLMMDMEYGYRTRDGVGRDINPEISYPRAIERTMQLARQANGRILPFIAFDPLRPGAFALVKEALEHKGFCGVKFYPPTGCTPDDNATAKRPSIFNDLGYDPADADKACAEFFAYCELRQIPIVAHCTPRGMERDRKIGTGLNAAPARWTSVLAKHPNLRLCLAHGGGGAFWFGADATTTDPDAKLQVEWSLAIIELCKKHPNVYCDFGHMGEALEKTKRESLVKRLVSLFGNADTSHMSEKLLFGSDFPMPLEARGYETYYRTFRAIFAALGAADKVDHEHHFFRGNALRFLDLSTFRKRAHEALSEEQHRHLEIMERGA